ncbi:MAG: hypothetical protein KME31_29195 [Tolypothrix carrinoi HA7290-LM1]|nr:hypothetical protein [Tolypothrix carrinoi HA7290-LM1]
MSALLPKLATKLWVRLEIYRVHDAMSAQGRREQVRSQLSSLMLTA